MHHFFVDPAQVMGDFIRITGPDVNHMKNALRMKQGEEVLVSDGTGTDYHCCLSSLNSDCVEARIVSADRDGRELPSRIWLFQGLPKSDKMELIIQKAVELGAAGIVPVSTKNAVVKLDAKKEEAKRKRWQAIAESAAKQSGRAVVPEVKLPVSYREAMKLSEELDVRLIPYECADELLSGTEETPMERTRNRLKTILPGQSIGIMIGPEGGLEKAEVEQSMEAGFTPVTLGKRILRTETAGLCILSVLMFQLEE